MDLIYISQYMSSQKYVTSNGIICCWYFNEFCIIHLMKKKIKVTTLCCKSWLAPLTSIHTFTMQCAAFCMTEKGSSFTWMSCSIHKRCANVAPAPFFISELKRQGKFGCIFCTFCHVTKCTTTTTFRVPLRKKRHCKYNSHFGVFFTCF